ncbi:hypothetical protein T08_14829 [Trichinella sp. T8]|nr:hypothetical protein T08_14829 [Trichinella sp. T8]
MDKVMQIRNHVDKYVITKHYHQLMPLSLATYFWIQIVKGIMAEVKNSFDSIKFIKHGET